MSSYMTSQLQQYHSSHKHKLDSTGLWSVL